MSRPLCVIPARGGSKGIPRKNLLPVAGKPLIVWTIEQALAARPEMQVVVSTEDEEIAQVSRDAGAEVPFLRPMELAQDTTATEPVVLHAMDYIRDTAGEPDIVMLLQATSPIRLPGTLDRALAEFDEKQPDSMVGVVAQTPFLWWAGDPPRADYPVYARPRRQELRFDDYRYRETGSLYVTTSQCYRAHSNRLGGRIELFVMEEIEGVDIDTDVDLTLTERTLIGIERKRSEADGH